MEDNAAAAAAQANGEGEGKISKNALKKQVIFPGQKKKRQQQERVRTKCCIKMCVQSASWERLQVSRWQQGRRGTG